MELKTVNKISVSEAKRLYKSQSAPVFTRSFATVAATPITSCTCVCTCAQPQAKQPTSPKAGRSSSSPVATAHKPSPKVIVKKTVATAPKPVARGASAREPAKGSLKSGRNLRPDTPAGPSVELAAKDLRPRIASEQPRPAVARKETSAGAGTAPAVAPRRDVPSGASSVPRGTPKSEATAGPTGVQAGAPPNISPAGTSSVPTEAEPSPTGVLTRGTTRIINLKKG